MSSVPGAFGKRVKCLCCNNPWNQADVPETAEFVVCRPCLSDNKGFSGIDPANFDENESLKKNFYLWSNGGWRAKNPIPLEYSSWNTFIVLRDLNLERLKTILDELGTSGGDLSGDLKKLSDYYNTFMDEATIELGETETLQEVADICWQAKVLFPFV